MKVFISYGSLGDQVTALRLQALGAANGLIVYVPPAHSRHMTEPWLDPGVAGRLNDADVVLGLIGARITEACRQELSAGLAVGKNMIVMCHPSLVQQLQPVFGSTLVVLDPAQPDLSEHAIVQHLKGIDAQQGAKNALLALGTLVLGLLILAPADQS